MIDIDDKLQDAQEMAMKFPATFDAPSVIDIADAIPGSFVKVSASGERFWVRVTKNDVTHIEGTVNNDLIRTHTHGLKDGDAVRFSTNRIYSTME